MRVTILLLFWVLIIGAVKSQSVKQNIQMPNVATLNKFIDFPVDKSTGIPSIYIPLYTLKEKDISVPISIAYHAGGIKVEEISSNVGLGWGLAAEATISRTVKGWPDESVGGWYTHSGPYPFVNPVCIMEQNPNPPFNYTGIFSNQVEGWQDTEPDLYYFHVGSYSGKFVFDTGRLIRLIPEQDIKIEKNATWGSSIYDFIVTTPDGIKYLFSGEYYDYSQLFGTGGDASPTPIAWHVKSIVTALNNRADFEYQEDGGIANRKIQHESTATGGPWHPVIANAEWRQTNRGYTIKSIKSNTCEIRFNYKSTLREDYRPDDQYFVHRISKALDNILVINRLSGDTVKRFAFYTSYFIANDNSVIANDDYLKRRLRLDELKEYNQFGDTLPGYKFYYNKYNFTYQNKLPNQVSTAQDHWGYYNGKSNNASLYPTVTFYNNVGDRSWTHPGADRNPDTNYKKAYILDEISFPTGGVTKYMYESIPSPYDITSTAGGLRVKSITTTSGADDSELHTSYSYENPQLVGGPPVYQQNVESDYDFGACYYNDWIYWPQCPSPRWQDTLRVYMVYTNPVNYTGELTSNYILFGKVTESKESNGSIETYYDVDDLEGEQDLGYAYDYPYTIAQPLLLSGKLQTEVIKDEVGHLKKQTEYYYSSYGGTATTNAYTLTSPFGWQSPHPYTIVTGAAQLIGKKETLYTSDINYLTTAVSYEYGGIPSSYDLYINHVPVKHHFVTKKTEFLNDTLITRMKYPLDFDHTGIVDNLISKNIVENPIETTVSRGYSNESIIKGNFVKFNSNGLLDKVYNLEVNKPVPKTSYTVSTINTSGSFSFDSKYKEDRLFNKYDEVGNVIEEQKKDNIYQSYLWGYSKTYPIAVVDNASSNEIFHSNFEDNEGWDANLTSYDNSRSHTGRRCGYINKPSAGEQYSHSTQWLTISLAQSKKFHYSGWVYSDGPSVDISLFMKQANTNAYFTYVDYVTTSVTGQWVYIEKDVTVPIDIAQLGIRIDNNGGGQVWFDDIRLHPSDAQMTTYTYDPLIGMSSQSDVSSKPVYYEYDSFGRLKFLKDKNSNILKTYDYQYQQTSGQ